MLVHKAGSRVSDTGGALIIMNCFDPRIHPTYTHLYLQQNIKPPLTEKQLASQVPFKEIVSRKNQSVENGHEYLNFTYQTTLEKNWQLFHKIISSHVEHTRPPKINGTVRNCFIT